MEFLQQVNVLQPSKAKKRPKRKTLKSVRKWISPEKNFPREGKCVFLSLGKRKCVFLSLEKRKCVFLSLGKFFSWHFWGVFCMKRAGVGVACVFSTKMWGEVFSWARIETWPARREFHLKWKKGYFWTLCACFNLKLIWIEVLFPLFGLSSFYKKRVSLAECWVMLTFILN